MSCEVGEVTESLENELCYDYNYELCSFSKLSVTSPTSQLILILQAFRHFTYVTAHSPTLPSLYLRHISFSNRSVASPTSQLILHPFFRLSYVTGFPLRHLASRPCNLDYCGWHLRLENGLKTTEISHQHDMKILSIDFKF